MKIIKSKGGYYYKEYKNGKKKRISKDEYLKIKSRTIKVGKSKSKKHILKGGGRANASTAPTPKDLFEFFERKLHNDDNQSIIKAC